MSMALIDELDTNGAGFEVAAFLRRKDEMPGCDSNDLTSNERGAMKGRFFFCMAAALLAGLAFATPSQAGTVVTTTVTFALTGGTSPTATDLEIFYSEDVSSGFSGLGVSSTGGLTITGGTPTFTAPNEITIDFKAAAATTGGGIVFEFTTNATGVGLGSGSTLTGVTGNPTDNNLHINVSQPSSVPEPLSMSLLGIGMSGLLAFRRFFRRSAVVR
jgi:hypothetical protein